jgi:tripartite ATP-independent transporter DctM subunit
MSHGFEVENKNPASSLSRGISYSENLLTALALGAMMLLPVAEIFLRKFFQTGISGVTVIVQHLVLLVGMTGGILAARDQRLLSLSTLSSFLNKRWTAYAKIGANSFATAVTAFLCVGSFLFAKSSYRFGKVLIFDIPTWTVQGILPVAFAIIAFRLWWTSSDEWEGRIVTAILAIGAIYLGFFPTSAVQEVLPIAFSLIALRLWWTNFKGLKGRAVAVLLAIGAIYLGSHLPPVSPESLVIPCLIGMGIAAILGAPIFTLLGGAALIFFWGEESPIASIALDHYQMVVNPSLATIPLFTLAGYFLAEGGASKRLIRVFLSLVGQIRGGPVIVTTLVCAFFTTFTGASGVTILALGGLLLPVLVAANFSERNAIGLLTGAGSLGVLFPPCLPLILYAVIATNSGANVEIKNIFLGGLLPGILLVGLTIWWGVTKAKPDADKEKDPFNAKEAYKAAWEAKWELLLPVVALVSLFGGFATPVEAAALTAFYALIIEVFIYRDLHLFRDVPRVMAECGLLVGGVLLILGVAMGFTNYLIDAQVPDMAVDWATSTITSKWVFLLLLNVFLLLVGCLMDIFSAIIVVVPLLIPIGLAFGVDPVHLGIIFLANLQLGYLTPPVGMNLFLSSYRFGKPLPEVIRATMPMLLVFLVSILLITYLPFLTTWLPSLFK